MVFPTVFHHCPHRRAIPARGSMRFSLLFAFFVVVVVTIVNLERGRPEEAALHDLVKRSAVEHGLWRAEQCLLRKWYHEQEQEQAQAIVSE